MERWDGPEGWRGEGGERWDDPEGWRGEGGGGRLTMGNACIPVADSFRYSAKLIQLCKV